MNNIKLQQSAFVLASTMHGSLLVNRNDYNLSENGYYGVGYDLLNSGQYALDEIKVILPLLDSRRTNFGDDVMAVDCGANIGVHTVTMAKHMFNWGRVLAFEAQERLFYALAGNVIINNCFNARVIWAAVGAAEGLINVPVPNYLSPSSFGSFEITKKQTNEYIGQDLDFSEEKCISTRMMSIDELNLKRCDFIKVDIEGMEMDMLIGAQKTIEKYKPQMLIEIIKSNREEIVGFLLKHGYKTFSLNINILAIHNEDPALTLVKCGVVE